MRKYFGLLTSAMIALALNACTWDFSSCVQNEKKCNGKTLLICSREGDWLDAWDCEASGRFCSASNGCIACRDSNDCKDSEKPVCNEKMNVCLSKDAKCAKGEMRCDGNALSTCDETDGVFVKTICADPFAYCDESKGCVACRDDNDCSDPNPVCNAQLKSCQARDAKCGVDETKCEQSGASKTEFLSYKCIGGRWVVDGINCKLGCNIGLTACAVCGAGDVKCENDQIYACDGGEWSKSGTTCENGCNTLGTACAECAEGEARCPDDSTLQTCNPTLSGFDKSKCPSETPICAVDKCVECRNNDDCKSSKIGGFCNTKEHICESIVDICNAGQTKCSENVHMTCDEGIWKTTTICETSQQCFEKSGCQEVLEHEHNFNTCRSSGTVGSGKGTCDEVSNSLPSLNFTLGSIIGREDDTIAHSLKLKALGTATVDVKNGVGSFSISYKVLQGSSQLVVSVNSLDGAVLLNERVENKVSKTFSANDLRHVGKINILIETSEEIVIENVKWTDSYQ